MTPCTRPDVSSVVADLVLLHGKIYTENPNQPWAEALAVKDGVISAVGTSEEISRHLSSATQVIDARGHLVLPGFVDSHIHFLLGSLNLARWALRLDSARTIGELQTCIRQYAIAHPEEEVITGYGWMYAVFGAAGLPDKRHLDEVVSDRPVILIAYGGHTTWTNSRAMQLAGVTDQTPSPANGEIVHDPISGEPTGVFKEDAEALVHKLLPKYAAEDPVAAILGGLKLANRFGITRVHSAGQDAENIRLYDEIRSRGLLTVRLYCALYVAPPAVTAEIIEKAESLRRTYHDDWLCGGAVKLYTDGIIESHTAAMLCCYSDDNRPRGSLNWTPERYQEAVTEFDRRGFQVWTHSIGDRGIRLSLDAYAQAAVQSSRKDARHRVEHVEAPHEADVPRFGELNVIASMQPLHAYPNANILGTWSAHVGPKRAQNAWPCNELFRTGAHVAFGSDWPIVTPDPWKAIQTLVTRQTVEGTPPGGWVPHQRISVQQAIHGYTLGAAYAGFLEQTEGSIERGKVADIIVVSQNILDVPATQIHATKVLYTIVGGRIVYHDA